MKYYLKNITLNLIILLSFILCFFINKSIDKDFIYTFLKIFSHITVLYIFIILICIIEYIIFKSFNKKELIFRNKTYNKFFIKNLLIEYIYMTLLPIFVILPALFTKFNLFMENIYSVILILINIVLMALLIPSIIRLIDIKVKNKVLSSCIFVGIFVVLEFVLENFNFFFAENILFDFSNIFVLALIYKHHFLVLMILLILILILNYAFLKLFLKQNYLLGDINDEN